MWPSLCQLRVARREESHRGEAGGVPSANLGRTLQESVGFPCLSRLLIAKNNAMVYDSMINYNVLKPTITTPTSPSRKNRGRQGGFWIGERFGFRKRGYARRAKGLRSMVYLVAEWIHFTLFGIILPTIKLKVYTFWGL